MTHETQENLITLYLKTLKEAKSNYSDLEWYKTHLANKNRFFLGSEQLLQILQKRTVTFPAYSRIKYFFKTFRYLGMIGKFLFIIKQKEKKALLDLKGSPPTNVIKTFSYNHSFQGDTFVDPFLGDLQHHLKKKKEKLIIVHESLGDFDCYREHNVSTSVLIHLYAFVNWTDYLVQYFYLFKNFFRQEIKSDNESLQYIHKNFIQESLSPQFYLHDIHYRAFKNIISKPSVEKIYSTFENNGWEKMLLLARNETLSDCRIISHQHVPVAPSALNYYLTKDEDKLLPDRIVTIGKILENFLISLHYPKFRLEAGQALRLSLHKYPLPHNTKRISLIALDGIPQAAVVLNTIVDHIKEFQALNWSFIVRFHPLYGIERMQKHLSTDIRQFDLFELSTSTLEEDIKRTQSVFYWGSTVAFEAMYSGRIVIHVPGKEVLSNDPITLSGGLHFVANDFLATVNSILNISQDDFNNRRLESEKYCVDYFGLKNSDKFKGFN